MSFLPLVLKFWREALIAVLVAALVGSCVSRDHRIAASAVAKAESRQADSTLRVVVPQLILHDTLIVHDSVKVRRAVDRVVTLRDTVLLHLTDTVLVREYVTRADSAAHACTDLLNDCAQFRAEATTTIAALKAKAAAAPLIVTRSCVVPNAEWALIGAAAGYFARRYQEKR